LMITGIIYIILKIKILKWQNWKAVQVYVWKWIT
jgi:hypothetical protein